tara:strand:- start:290 stop:445 length:156 start_codon:yes stop_codon:yes gene_type:complete
MSLIKTYKHEQDAEQQRSAIEDMECAQFHGELFDAFDSKLSTTDSKQQETK